jgi:hypothetical protein
MISTQLVLAELEAQEGPDGPALQWARNFPDIFRLPEERIQESARGILKTHPGLIDLKRSASVQADPFLIATAMVESCAVVTQEGRSRDPSKPKIPNVCHYYGIECINVLEMFRRENLRL